MEVEEAHRALLNEYVAPPGIIKGLTRVVDPEVPVLLHVLKELLDCKMIGLQVSYHVLKQEWVVGFLEKKADWRGLHESIL